jgi:hypothetical protein
MRNYDIEPERLFVCNGCEERTERYKDSDYCQECFEKKAYELEEEMESMLLFAIDDIKEINKKCDKLGIDRVSTEFIRRFTAAFEKPKQ